MTIHASMAGQHVAALHVKRLCIGCNLLAAVCVVLQLASNRLEDDDPQQMQTLGLLFNSTTGVDWVINTKATHRLHPWFTPGVSYCRWRGVTCCQNSPLAAIPNCTKGNSIVILDVKSFGLRGSLPPNAQALPDLTVLNLGDNPGLNGGLPEPWLPASLLWLSVKGTNLSGCTDNQSFTGQTPTPSCQLHPSLELLPPTVGTAADAPAAVQCPTLRLRSFTQRTQNLASEELAWLTSPYSHYSVPGSVYADPSFTQAYQCSCTDAGKSLTVDATGKLYCKEGTGSGGTSPARKWILIVCLVAIVPHVLLGLSVIIFLKHKAYLHRLIRFKEDMMQTKRTKVPGTPGFILKDGQGLVPIADTMVTWVWTDVSSSTLLWEWNASVMDVAIDLHNKAIRELLDEFGGHEIRNEGDGFVLSFHDALDGVNFCIKAQEQLHTLKWPAELLTHKDAAVVTVGDLLHEAATASLGPSIMAGLRVRMAINTGMPEDIFLHDLTEQIDYRGSEYDLTAELCDLAAGGQILIGPKTYQSWSRNYSELGQEAWANLLAEAAKTDMDRHTHTSMVDRVKSLTIGKHAWGGMRSSPSRSSIKRPGRVDSLAWMGRQGQPSSPLSRRLSVCATGDNWSNHLGSAGSMLGVPHVPQSSGQMPSNPKLFTLQLSNLSGLPQSHSNSSIAAAALQEPTLSPACENDSQTLGSLMLSSKLAMSMPPARTTSGGKTRRHSLPHLPQVPVPTSQDQPSQTFVKSLITAASASIPDHESLAGTGEEPDMQGQVLLLNSNQAGLDPDNERLAPVTSHTIHHYRPAGCMQHLRDRMLSKCLACLRLATSSTEDTDMLGTDDESGSQHGCKVPQKTNTAKGTVIDMGYYRMSQVHTIKNPPQMDAHPGEHTISEQVVHLVQVLPSSLLARALFFPWPTQLPHQWEKISPGFFDAPGSSCFMPPGVREVMALGHVPITRPVVVMVFSSIDGYKEVAAYNVRLAQDSTSMHNACIRETLSVCNGYECKEFEGSFMLAFDKASTAVEWAITLQLALLHVPWPTELLACNQLTGEVRDAGTKRVMYRGLRARVGIYSGTIDRVSVARTGRADMFGQPVNRAARLMSAAHGGMCVCDATLKKQVLAEWSTKFAHWHEPPARLVTGTSDVVSPLYDSKENDPASIGECIYAGPPAQQAAGKGGWRILTQPHELIAASSADRHSPGATAPREFKLSRSFGSSMNRSQQSSSQNVSGMAGGVPTLQHSPTLRTYVSIGCGSIPAKEEPSVEIRLPAPEPSPAPTQQASKNSLHSPDLLSSGQYTFSHGSATPSSLCSPMGTQGGAPPVPSSMLHDVPYMLQPAASTPPMQIRGGKLSRLNASMSCVVDLDPEHVEMKPQQWDPQKWSRASTRRLSATSGKSGSAVVPPSSSPNRTRAPLDKMASGPLHTPSSCPSVASLPASIPRRQSWQTLSQAAGLMNNQQEDIIPGSSPANSSSRAPTRGSSMPCQLSQPQPNVTDASCLHTQSASPHAVDKVSFTANPDTNTRFLLTSSSSIPPPQADAAHHVATHGQHNNLPWQFLGPDPNGFGHGALHAHLSTSPSSYIYPLQPRRGRHGSGSELESHPTTATNSQLSKRIDELHEATSGNVSGSTVGRHQDSTPVHMHAGGHIADSSRLKATETFLSLPPYAQPSHTHTQLPHARRSTLDDTNTSGTEGHEPRSMKRVTFHMHQHQLNSMNLNTHSTCTTTGFGTSEEHSKRLDVHTQHMSTCNSGTTMTVESYRALSTAPTPNLPGRSPEKSQGGASAVSRAFPRGLSTNGGDVAMSAESNAVMAECYRIARSPQSVDGAALPSHAPSASHSPGITMIRYRAKSEISIARDDDMVPIDQAEALKPSAMSTVIPLVPVDVSVWALGSYRLKGVAELVMIIQILPVALEGRLEQVHEGTLNKSKARCVKPSMDRLDRVTILLPDVTKMSCCTPLPGEEVPLTGLTFPNLAGYHGYQSGGGSMPAAMMWDTVRGSHMIDEDPRAPAALHSRGLPKLEVARPSGLVVPSPGSQPSQGPAATPAALPTTYSSYSASLPSANKGWTAGSVDAAGEGTRRETPRHGPSTNLGNRMMMATSPPTSAQAQDCTPRFVGAPPAPETQGIQAYINQGGVQFQAVELLGQDQADVSHHVSSNSIYVPVGNSLPAMLYNSMPGGSGSLASESKKSNGAPDLSKGSKVETTTHAVIERPWHQLTGPSSTTSSQKGDFAGPHRDGTSDCDEGPAMTAEDVAHVQRAASVLLHGLNSASKEQGADLAEHSFMVQKWAQQATQSSSGGGLMFDLDLHGTPDAKYFVVSESAQPEGASNQLPLRRGSQELTAHQPGQTRRASMLDLGAANPAESGSANSADLKGQSSSLHLTTPASQPSSGRMGFDSSRFLPSLRYGLAGSVLGSFDVETAAATPQPGTSETVTFPVS